MQDNSPAITLRDSSMESSEYIAAWWDGKNSMDASSFWRNESMTPIHAALILSGHNPEHDNEANMIEAAEKTTSGGIGPEAFRALKIKFEAANKDKPRTLKDWMEYAQQHEEKIHSWMGEWLQAGGAPLPVSTPHPAPASGPVPVLGITAAFVPPMPLSEHTEQKPAQVKVDLAREIYLTANTFNYYSTPTPAVTPASEPVMPAAAPPAPSLTVTPAALWAKLDMSGERGARRLILEKWGDIEKEYGPSPDGREVWRVLKRDPEGEVVKLKTVQNHLAKLRGERLIP